MTIFILGSYAHRILNNGLVESTPVVKTDEGILIPDSGWQERSKAEMGLTGGDFALIRSELSRFSQMVFALAPVSNPVNPVQPNPGAPR